MIRLQGSRHFRHRIVLAQLSGRAVRIEKIRSFDEDPGIRDFEASFLRLIHRITNGSRIDINETGTTVTFTPGSLIGGAVKHDCGKARGVGYFLEGILPLAPFCKKPLRLTLEGMTNSREDVGVDTIRTVLLPVMKKFGIESDLELKILRRGAPPSGGGAIEFTCPICKELKPFFSIDEGQIRRVRGVAYTARVSPQMANRVLESARGVLNDFLPDVFIYTDHYKGQESGLSPGYALSLVAESTTGCFYAAEDVGDAQHVPEELGKRVAEDLLAEIARGGCADAISAPLALTLMALTPEDASQIRLGPLTKFTVQTLRLLKEFFGVEFRMKTDRLTGTVLLTCVGIGYRNISRIAL